LRIKDERKLKNILGSVSADMCGVSQLQDELSKSEEKYRTILEEMDEGYYEIDAKGNLVFINEATARMYGVTRREMLGMSYKVFTPRDQWAAAVHDYAGVFATGMPYRRRSGTSLKKDGTLIYREDSIFPIRDEKGQIIGVRGIARDVTERKRAENALLEEKRFSDAVIDSLPGIFYIIDKEGAFLRYNRNAMSIMGYSPEEAKNLRAMDIVAEEDKLPFVSKLSEIFKNGTGDAEITIVTKAGRKIPYHIFAKVFTVGGNSYLLGTGVDITARMEAERARDEIEKNYRLLAENTTDIVSIVDMDLNLVWLSASGEKLTGFSVEEQKIMPLNKKVTPESAIRTMQLFGRALKEEAEGAFPPDRHYDIESELYRKDGSTVWTETMMRFVRDGRGKAIAILMQGRDISARKQAEQALQKTMEDLKRSNEELQQFAYVASHDLQEPLRMVSSYVQLLEKRYKDKLDPDAHDFINYAVSGARRMQNLINDLLSYSRVGTRGKPFQMVDCSEVLYAATSNLEIAIRENEAVIEHDDLPQVFGDEGQLVQVFQNIIGNAVKFHGKEPPRITVRAELQGAEWVFSIKDNGIGIEPQFFERIFLVFQRLHGNEYPGTGIGLSIARKIILRHGGRMWPESQPGQGSTFYFTVPVGEQGEYNI
jgi:PAS domain S-box-containing protein